MEKPKKCRRRSIRNIRRASMGFHSPPAESAPYGSAWIDHDLDTNLDNMVLSESKLQHNDVDNSVLQNTPVGLENPTTFVPPPSESARVCGVPPQSFPVTSEPKEPSGDDSVKMNLVRSLDSFSFSPDLPLCVNSVEQEDGQSESFIYSPPSPPSRPVQPNQLESFDLSLSTGIIETSTRDKDDNFTYFQTSGQIDVSDLQQAYQDLSLNFSPVPDQDQTIDYLVKSLGFDSDVSFSPDDVRPPTPGRSTHNNLAIGTCISSMLKSVLSPKPVLQSNKGRLPLSPLCASDATFIIDSDSNGAGRPIIGNVSSNDIVSNTSFNSCATTEYSHFRDPGHFGDGAMCHSEGPTEAGDFVCLESARTDQRQVLSSHVDHFVSFVDGMNSELERIRDSEISGVGSQDSDEDRLKDINEGRSKEYLEATSPETDTVRREESVARFSENDEIRSEDIVEVRSLGIDESRCREIFEARSLGADGPVSHIASKVTSNDILALQPGIDHISYDSSINCVELEKRQKRAKRRSSRKFERHEFSIALTQTSDVSSSSISSLPEAVAEIPPSSFCETLQCDKENQVPCDNSGNQYSQSDLVKNQSDEAVRNVSILSEGGNKQKVAGKTKRGRKSGSIRKGRKSGLLEVDESAEKSISQESVVVAEQMKKSSHHAAVDDSPVPHHEVVSSSDCIVADGLARAEIIDRQNEMSELEKGDDSIVSGIDVTDDEPAVESRNTRGRRSRKSWGDVASHHQARTSNRQKSALTKTSSGPASSPTDAQNLEQMYLQKNYKPIKPTNLETIKEVPANGAFFNKLRVDRSIKFPENLCPSVRKQKMREKKVAKHSKGHNKHVPISDDEFQARLRDIELDLEVAD